MAPGSNSNKPELMPLYWRHPPVRIRVDTMSNVHEPKATTPATPAEELAALRAAHGIAAMVGCDHRTALRALAHGVGAIRSRRLREEIRVQLEQLRARP